MTASGAFQRLDHDLPDGAPPLRSAAVNYMDALGIYSRAVPIAVLWGTAGISMAMAEALVSAAEMAGQK